MKFSKILFHNIIKYFFSFALILLTSLLLFVTAQENAKQALLDRTRLQIQNGLISIEDSINRLDLTAQTMYENQNFSKLGWLTNNSSAAEKIILLRSSSNLLNKISALADHSVYNFVLFRDNDLYLSNYQCNTSFPTYYNKSLLVTLPEGTITDAAAFKNLLLNCHKNNQIFLKLDRINYSDGTNLLEQTNTLLYLTDGIINKRSSRKLFCFVLDPDYLTKTILTPEMRQHGFLIIRDTFSNEALFSYGTVPADILSDMENGVWYSGTNPKFYDTNDYYYLQSINNRLGWKIVTGISICSVTEQMESAQHLLITYFYLGIITTLILAIYFSLSRYCGFKKMIQAIPQEELIPPQTRFYNDYQFITNNITKLDEKKESYKLMTHKLKQQNQAILLENLITRDEYNAQDGEAFQELFPIEPEFYCVVMVRLLHLSSKDYSSISVEMANYLQQKRIHIIHNVHSGIYDELFLIELLGTQEGNTTSLLDPFREMAEIVAAKYNCFMHIGISAVGTKLSNITRCYTQAKQVVQSQYLYDTENVVQLYNIMDRSFQENPVTIDFLTRFYNMLISVRYQDIDQELSQLENRCTRMPWLYEAYRKEIFFSLKNIFHSAIIHLNCNDGKEQLPAYAATISCQDMIQAFRECAQWLCDYVASVKKNKSADLKDRILEILEQEYHDSNLSAYTVSQKIGISEKYLYQFWKNQTGETFVASLFRIRIEKAQDYLEQTDYSNAKIAELTGFSSVNTFYRNFQKQTGMSPKQYQEHKKL